MGVFIIICIIGFFIVVSCISSSEAKKRGEEIKEKRSEQAVAIRYNGITVSKEYEWKCSKNLEFYRFIIDDVHVISVA